MCSTSNGWWFLNTARYEDHGPATLFRLPWGPGGSVCATRPQRWNLSTRKMLQKWTRLKNSAHFCINLTPVGCLLSPIPSGELTFCYGTSPFLMGKSTISMAIFHGKLLVHQRVRFWARGTTFSRSCHSCAALLGFEVDEEVSGLLCRSCRCGKNMESDGKSMENTWNSWTSARFHLFETIWDNQIWIL